MIKEYKLEDIDPLGDIKNKVLLIVDLFRENYTDSEIYPSVLFLLSLQKDGILDNLTLSQANNLYEEIVSQINNADGDSIKTYKSLLEVFKSFLSDCKNEILSDAILRLHNLNQLFLEEHFTRIFEDLLYQLSRSQGKLASESLMPMELCRFMTGLAKLPENATVYNPFAGLASFGVFLNEGQNYLGQELDMQICALGALRLAANQRIGDTRFYCEDSIIKWPSKNLKFDLIISNPPFGLKLNQIYRDLYPGITTVEQFIIDKSMSSLKDTGKLIIVVPNGFLFRGGSEKKTRESLVNSDLLESIISVPGGVYTSTSIPVVILLINKSKNNKGFINFIDAANYVDSSNNREKTLNDYSLNSIVDGSRKTNSFKSISVEKITNNDYVLSVSRYLMENYEGTPLKNFVEIINFKRIQRNEIGKIIRNNDLKDSSIDNKLELINIPTNDVPRGSIEITESCILISSLFKATSLKPTYFKFEKEPIYLINSFIKALKIDKSKIDIDYLINEFYSEQFTDQFKALSSGNAGSQITNTDLLSIKINVPNLEAQKAKTDGIKQAFILNKKRELELQQELLGLKDETFREFASIKHTFRQYLNALKSNVAGTRLFVLNNQDTNITLDSIYSKNLNKSFGEHLLGLDGTIDSMAKLLTSFENNDMSHNQKDHDLEVLTESAQNRFKNPEIFQFEETYIDIESFTYGGGAGCLAPQVSIDEEDFYRIFSNVVSNAIDHGFKDLSIKHIIRTSITFDENERMCILEISNNGLSMPNDFTLKDLTTRGEKTTDSKGTGMGGADIKNILKKYKGTLGVTNINTDEFPVTYIIKLPLYTVHL